MDVKKDKKLKNSLHTPIHAMMIWCHPHPLITHTRFLFQGIRNSTAFQYNPRSSPASLFESACMTWRDACASQHLPLPHPLQKYRHVKCRFWKLSPMRAVLFLSLFLAAAFAAAALSSPSGATCEQTSLSLCSSVDPYYVKCSPNCSF